MELTDNQKQLGISILEDDHIVTVRVGEDEISHFTASVSKETLDKEIDQMENILWAFVKSDAFLMWASEWARSEGWSEPA